MISKLKEVCVMCKEEAASVTMRPCGHMYCQGTYLYILWIYVTLYCIFTYQHAVGDRKSALSASHLLKAEMAWVSIMNSNTYIVRTLCNDSEKCSHTHVRIVCSCFIAYSNVCIIVTVQ